MNATSSNRPGLLEYILLITVVAAIGFLLFAIDVWLSLIIGSALLTGLMYAVREQRTRLVWRMIQGFLCALVIPAFVLLPLDLFSGWLRHGFIALMIVSVLLPPAWELIHARYPLVTGRIQTHFGRGLTLYLLPLVLISVVSWYVSSSKEIRGVNDFLQGDRWSEGRRLPTTDSAVVYFHLRTFDVMHRNYLESCLMIARAMKKSGARGVFVPIPDFAGMNDSVEFQHVIDLLTALDSTNIVVFGIAPRRIDGGSYVSTFLDHLTPAPRWGALLADGPFRFHPFAENPGDVRVPDASLHLVEKYYGAESYAETSPDRHKVRVGRVELPMFGDGSVLVLPVWTPNVLSPVYGEYDEMRGLRFLTANESNKVVPPDQVSQRYNFKNRLVLISPYGFEQLAFGQIDRLGDRCKAILSGRFLDPAYEWNFGFVLLYLLLASFVSFRSPSWTSSLSIFVLGIAFQLGAGWIFFQNDLYLNTFMFLISTALATIVFPLVQSSLETRELERNAN